MAVQKKTFFVMLKDMKSFRFVFTDDVNVEKNEENSFLSLVDCFKSRVCNVRLCKRNTANKLL